MHAAFKNNLKRLKPYIIVKKNCRLKIQKNTFFEHFSTSHTQNMQFISFRPDIFRQTNFPSHLPKLYMYHHKRGMNIT